MSENDRGTMNAVTPRKPAATIYDIAQLAGVNASTVSRALSTPGRISAKTEQKIHAAAKELNYRVNPAARALLTGRTRTIGLIVADITNPVFFDIVRGAEREAAEHDYTLVLAEFRESAETEMFTARRLMPSVDGLILATSRLEPDEIRSLAEEKPVVVINREVDDITSIVADVDSGIERAVEHLVSLGHTRLAYVAGPRRSWMSHRRWSSIQRSAEAAGIESVAMSSDQPNLEAGRAIADEVVSSGATAVMAYNDLIAIGLMQALIARDVRVPDDISVIGFDNIFGADWTTPGLTSIAAPHTEAGMYAARGILSMLDGSSSEHGTQDRLATSLVLRGSTGPRPAV
jgi:DNA-binding LacI/PurR family transcriptional regulator